MKRLLNQEKSLGRSSDPPYTDGHAWWEPHQCSTLASSPGDTPLGTHAVQDGKGDAGLGPGWWRGGFRNSWTPTRQSTWQPCAWPFSKMANCLQRLYFAICFQRPLPHPVPVRSTMLFDKVQTWGICLQRSVSWPGVRGITWDLCVILFFLFLRICIFTALIIWNLLEMITTLRNDQQLTQTGYNQTNASLVNKSLNV